MKLMHALSVEELMSAVSESLESSEVELTSEAAHGGSLGALTCIPLMLMHS
jgi:hypothetical protein